MRAIVIFVLLCVRAANVSADIFEWRDAQGVRHFTNVIDEVPSELRDATRVVARERGGQAQEDRVESAAAAPRQAQVVYDARRLQRVYADGVERGRREARRSAQRYVPAPAQVLAPMVIANVPVLPPYMAYLPPPCVGPFVARGFDNGRLRHQTWRLRRDRCRSPITLAPSVGVLDPRFVSRRRVPPHARRPMR